LSSAPFVREAIALEENPTEALSLSPLALVRPRVSPVISVHGAADTTVPPDQTARLSARIREVGGVAHEISIPGARHGLSDGQLAIAYRAVFAFLERQGVL
jgi:dipeptidyl aminopeptidase/acylaminoacyl peptidase